MTSTATLDRIARRHLGIDTLAVRNSDALDFREVGVAGVKAALQAAFSAGQQASAAAAKKPVTAPEHYADTLAKVRDTMEQLTRAVEAHALRQAKEPGHWGYVGDLNGLDMALTEALARVG